MGTRHSRDRAPLCDRRALVTPNSPANSVRVPNRNDDDLSALQGMHLIQESDSAKHLLAYGLGALSTAEFIETTRNPIMTMLSIGVEKMLTLGLGLQHVGDNRVCLPARVLQTDLRHDLIKMEALLRQAIRDNVDRATHRYNVDQALAAVVVWPPLLSALNRYGQEGRFYYLDARAENPQREEDLRRLGCRGTSDPRERRPGLRRRPHQEYTSKE